MTIRFSSLPIKTPKLRISSGLGFREILIDGRLKRANHTGVDIPAPSNTPIYAVSSGVVVRVVSQPSSDNDCGVSVKLEHTETDDTSKKYTTLYCHQLVGGPKVTQGEQVAAGQEIGRVGNTGFSSGPHLHFQLADSNGTPIDPTRYLNEIRGTTEIVLPRTEAPARPNSRRPIGVTAPETNITPFISTLESFHPRVQFELTSRRLSDNTANTYTPFVKLTSLVNVLRQNLEDGAPAKVISDGETDLQDISAWCPSLGPHGEEELIFDDLYLPQSNRSIVGYAVATQTDGTNQIRVPVVVEARTANKTEQANIPMPGITEVSTERSLAGPMGVRGGLFKADIKIIAYSVGQVDTLLKYFLRPATRVVLEFGNQSATQRENFVGSTERVNTFKPFNWNQRSDEIGKIFSDIITTPDSGSAFINEYVYNNNGNYEIFFGYVVKFDLKYNKNNTYEISLTVHSIQHFEIPTTHTGVKALCPDATNPCKVYDVRQYFSPQSATLYNSFTSFMTEELKKVERAKAQSKSYEWADDFILIANNQPGVNGAGSAEAGTTEAEYFVSWRFFIERLMLDADRGIISVIRDDNTKKLLELGLLRAVRSPSQTEVTNGAINNKLQANQVNYHPHLRSTNPNVMVIYNYTAESKKTAAEYQTYTDFVNVFNPTQTEYDRFRGNTSIANFIIGSGVGTFRNIDKNNQDSPGIGSLTNGVWLNTKAIKQAFTSQDTITSAIDYLLTTMNDATEGYWNLQLYSSDRQNSGLFVVDMGLSKRLSVMQKPPVADPTVTTEDRPYIDNEEKNRESVLDGIDKITIERYQKSTEGIGVDEPKYLYMFNRGTKALTDGKYLGSELLDLNVEFNLPQVIAVQAIAGIGGPAQKSTLQSIDIPELNRISLIKGIFSECTKNEICSPTEETCPDNQLFKGQKYNIRRTDETTRVPASVRAEFLRRQQRGAAPADNTRVEYPRVERKPATTPAQAEALQSLFAQENGMTVDSLRELNSLGTALYFIVINKGLFLKKLNFDSTNAEDGRTIPETHAFNSSNLTKTISSVTLPGIGGIELLQSFLIDRVPTILERGFYVVTKIVNKFTPSGGWITTIDGRFRYAPERETKANTRGTNLPKICTTPSTPAEPGGTTPPTEGGPWAAYKIPVTSTQLVTIIKKFQSDNGLPQTGQRNRATITKLREFQARYGLKVDGNLGRAGQTTPKMVELLKAGQSLVATAPSTPTIAQRLLAGEVLDESGQPIQ